MPYCDEVSSPSLADLNAVNCDVDCVKAHCSRGPVGTVGSISVGTDQHVLTGSVEKWLDCMLPEKVLCSCIILLTFLESGKQSATLRMSSFRRPEEKKHKVLKLNQ